VQGRPSCLCDGPSRPPVQDAGRERCSKSRESLSSNLPSRTQPHGGIPRSKDDAGPVSTTPFNSKVADVDIHTPPLQRDQREIDGYEFEGRTRFDNLFTGIAVERPQSLDPNSRIGLEGIGHEDTYNGDYGRLPCANGGAR